MYLKSLEVHGFHHMPIKCVCISSIGITADRWTTREWKKVLDSSCGPLVSSVSKVPRASWCQDGRSSFLAEHSSRKTTGVCFCIDR